MKRPQKIPYGISNFESLRTENYVYIDKTRFIEQIENEPTKYHFLIRPRKFGKSLFLSMLRHYYDICSAKKFDVLFGNLYIGKNPTSNRNAYFVMNFSFSGLNTNSIEQFEISFTEAIKSSIESFLTEHSSIIAYNKELKVNLRNRHSVRALLEFAFDVIESFQRKAYIIIDEYDHFANDLIARGTNLSAKQYKQLIWANGVVRDFYETLKDRTQTVIEKIFITGITPIMLDDVTSGFNISNNLSLKEQYNEILGFTEDEVAFFMQQICVEKSEISVDLEYLYNGYRFHVDGKNKLYNSSMINYFFLELKDTGKKIENLIDDNLKTDYGRIKMLLNKMENVTELEKIIEYNKVPAKVTNRFSIDKIHEPKNFLSLLYYMGLVTLDKESNSGLPLFKIPNYSIKTMYWEYMENMIMERNPRMLYKPSEILGSLALMAFDNDYEPFFENFRKNFVSMISNRDLLRFSEKNIKFLLLSIFFQTNLYLPISEPENTGGYTDIYLQRRNNLYPGIKTDWILEIKYIKQSDSDNGNLIESKKNEAIEQLKRYKRSVHFIDRTDIRYLAVVFLGKKGAFIEEVF